MSKTIKENNTGQVDNSPDFIVTDDFSPLLASNDSSPNFIKKIIILFLTLFGGLNSEYYHILAGVPIGIIIILLAFVVNILTLGVFYFLFF